MKLKMQMQYKEHVSNFLYVISTCYRHSYLLLSHMQHNCEQGQCVCSVS